MLRAPFPAPTKAFAKEGRRWGRLKAQAGECHGPALEVEADLCPLPGVMTVGKGHMCLQREEKAIW